MKRFYDTYVEKFNTQPVSILEIGSRDGNDAEELRKYSQLESSSVYVVEPHPQSYKNIVHNYPDFHAYELAISNSPGVVNFNAIPHDQYTPAQVGTSSLLSRNVRLMGNIPPTWKKVLAIKGSTLLQLIDRSEIDLIKVDVEGFTQEVIESFGDDIRLLKALHLEVEILPLTLWEGQKHYDEVKRHMIWYGFEEKYYDGKYWPMLGTGENLQGDSIWVRNG